MTTETRLADALERSRTHNKIVAVEVDDIGTAIAELRRLERQGLIEWIGNVDLREDGERTADIWAALPGAADGDMLWRLSLISR